MLKTIEYSYNTGTKLKTLLIIQIAVELFQTPPELSSRWSSQKQTGRMFEILSLRLLIFFCLGISRAPL